MAAYVLEQRQVQTQRLLLTQSQQRAIALLRMSADELSEHVAQEVAANPLLAWGAQARPVRRGQVPLRGLGSRDDAAVYVARSQESLSDHLHAQAQLLTLTAPERRTLTWLIDCVDDRGFLESDVLSAAARAGFAPPLSESMLQVLRAMDPAGVGAFDVVDSLRLQLLRFDAAARVIAERLLDCGLAVIARGARVDTATRLGCSLADLQAALALIRTLDPHPARRFQTEPTVYTQPDLLAQWAGDRYVVSAVGLGDPVPRLLARPQADDRRLDAEYRKLERDAVSLVRGLELRRYTLVRVGECVVTRQRAFVEQGPEWLRPLTQRAVAQELGLHESTVSRAVADKWIAVPRGTLRLRDFFCSGVGTENGDAASGASVRACISRLIASEDPRHPRSDRQLADLLGVSGIRCARRTVAKYREELGIPGSALRRLGSE